MGDGFEISMTSILAAFVAGLWLGSWLQARLWRSKGDHEYMNRMASGGALYTVKRVTHG